MNLMNSPVTLTIFNTGQSCLWSTFPLPLLDYFDANLKHHISFVKFYYVSLKPRLLFKSHNYSIIVMPKLKKKSLLSSNIQCLNFLDFVKIMFHIKKKSSWVLLYMHVHTHMQFVYLKIEIHCVRLIYLME